MTSSERRDHLQQCRSSSASTPTVLSSLDGPAHFTALVYTTVIDSILSQERVNQCADLETYEEAKAAEEARIAGYKTLL